MRDWQHLVEVLFQALAEQVSTAGKPTWVYVRSDPDDQGSFDLGLSEEPDALLGRLAPPDWDAVGVVASGRTVPVHHPGRSEARLTRRRTTIRMAYIVTRHNGTYCKAVTSDGVVLEDPPQSGFLVDCLRCCLGLPPACPTEQVPRPGVAET
ncbi:MAG: hypothetical protein M1435_02345 [Actinobacteria bacterium]|nr:hypothetical protein [Actinomycetota bacterium]